MRVIAILASAIVGAHLGWQPVLHATGFDPECSCSATRVWGVSGTSNCDNPNPTVTYQTTFTCPGGTDCSLTADISLGGDCMAKSPGGTWRVWTTDANYDQTDNVAFGGFCNPACPIQSADSSSFGCNPDNTVRVQSHLVNDALEGAEFAFADYECQ